MFKVTKEHFFLNGCRTFYMASFFLLSNCCGCVGFWLIAWFTGFLNECFSVCFVLRYAINAELLRHTMDYFRTALRNTTDEQATQGIQISLYVQKDLWEWLLHLATIQYRQTRETLPPIQTSLALPLFATAVLLGIRAARDICLRHLKQSWPAAIHERDR